MDIQEYLEDRVKGALSYYEKAANKAKRKHVWAQTAIIILGLL